MIVPLSVLCTIGFTAAMFCLAYACAVIEDHWPDLGLVIVLSTLALSLGGYMIASSILY